MQLLTGTYVQVAQALQQINANCELPNWGTTSWSYFYSTSVPDLAFIICPPEDGWNPQGSPGFSYEQMMEGVVDVAIQDFDDSWQPVSPPFSG